MPGAKIKSVYGTPWSKLVEKPIPITHDVLHRLGQAIVDAIVTEAKKDFAKQGRTATPRGQPEGLPDSTAFFKSFGYRISGKSTVEVTCTWPYIDQLLEGRKPYPMTWLTKAQGVSVVPMKDARGVVVFRATPLKMNEAWVHPGFARHSFVQRGVKKGRQAMVDIITAEATKYLFKNGDALR